MAATIDILYGFPSRCYSLEAHLAMAFGNYTPAYAEHLAMVRHRCRIGKVTRKAGLTR